MAYCREMSWYADGRYWGKQNIYNIPSRAKTRVISALRWRTHRKTIANTNEWTKRDLILWVRAFYILYCRFYVYNIRAQLHIQSRIFFVLIFFFFNNLTCRKIVFVFVLNSEHIGWFVALNCVVQVAAAVTTQAMRNFKVKSTNERSKRA